MEVIKINALDHTVIEVLTEPIHRKAEDYDYWKIKVKSTCYGRETESNLVFKTKEECEKIKEGYVYQA